MRQMLELYANSHPDVATLIDGLRQRRNVNRSTNMIGPGLGPFADRRRARSHGGLESLKPQKKAKPGRR